MAQLRQAQVASDCFTAVLHFISNDTSAQRRRAREKDRLARQWSRCAWLAIIALMLCAALCLQSKSRRTRTSLLLSRTSWQNRRTRAVLGSTQYPGTG